MTNEFDARDFRTAAGQFMTGVTVVTTLDADGAPAGLTANSFTTVSLHPPMVLFCLGVDSANLDAFEAGNGFVVHVLAAEQQDLSQQFASKGIDRFDGVDWSPGRDGRPVLSGALATFDCDLAHTYDGGDHRIYVGRVMALSTGDTEAHALGYFRGRYVASSAEV
ncbi:MAG: flavin reductase family protein [Acidimicrobiia bacterium]|nr:flavin reductase family protein [Acidimicrobiia bacterium]MDH4307142.1 flavin reductase family protein [Acidimicrobiia bacterium]